MWMHSLLLHSLLVGVSVLREATCHKASHFTEEFMVEAPCCENVISQNFMKVPHAMKHGIRQNIS